MAAVQSGQSSGASQGQEFVVRIPKTTRKRYHVMRFNAAHNQDVTKWTQVRMERENNLKEFKAEEDLPKFGAGSEFGREQKEEARRKKYGIVTKKYNPDDQPWLVKIGGKTGKKFKGIREGGVSDNTSYYVFCKAPDGVFEAFPVEEWYNFNPVGRFKALTAEEAEEEFEKRDKVMNHFSIMVRKKMAAEDGVLREEREEKKKKQKDKEDFKITDVDEWPSDSDGAEDDEEREEDEEEGKKKKGQDKKKRRKSDDEAVEESDEGDFDDREVDYMSESSSEEEEPEEEKAGRELKGVEDEEALREIDQSEEEAEKEEEKGSEEEGSKEADPKAKGKADKKEATSKPASRAASSGESSSESSDSDFDDSKFQSAMFMQKPKSKKGSDSAAGSRANTPTKHVGDDKKGKGSGKAQKRKAKESSPSGTDGPKRTRHEAAAPVAPNTWSGGTEGITEESVRRYLLRKPMTTTELLQKFKSKKTGMSSEKLVNTIAQILKKLNPIKQTIKGKLYLSIKP